MSRSAHNWCENYQGKGSTNHFKGEPQVWKNIILNYWSIWHHTMVWYRWSWLTSLGTGHQVPFALHNRYSMLLNWSRFGVVGQLQWKLKADKNIWFLEVIGWCHKGWALTILKKILWLTSWTQHYHVGGSVSWYWTISCGILVIWISKCGVAVFLKPVECIF